MAHRFNRFDQLIDAWEPRLKAAFLEAVYVMRNGADIAALVERLEKGDVEGAILAVGLDPAQFRSFDRAIGQAYEEGGRYVADRFPRLAAPGGNRVVFQFNVRNPSA